MTEVRNQQGVQLEIRCPEGLGTTFVTVLWWFSSGKDEAKFLGQFSQIKLQVPPATKGQIRIFGEEDLGVIF